jgi:CelD/BcsL family acetyltransferase involved in cellulose biosynthesis
VLRMECPEVFHTYEWAIAVQRACGDSRKPLLVLAYECGSLIGLVAFARENNRTGDVVFLTGTTADYCDFLSPADKRSEFVEAVLGELLNRKIHRLVLTNMPADSCSVPALFHAAAGHKYHFHSRTAYFCARVVLGTAEQRSLLKQLTAGKKRLRRNLRELEKQGALCVRHDTEWKQIEPILQSFSKAHVARFLATGRISTLLRPERRKFLYELARELSSSGWMVVSRLLVGGVPVAWNYGFKFPGSWFWYQPTVESDVRYRDFSPGYCLLAKIVELACDCPEIDVVDLGLGAEDYKERFANTARETMYFVLNGSFTHHLHTVVRDGAAAVTKSAPVVERIARRAISSAARLRARVRDAGPWGLVAKVARQIRGHVFAFDEVSFFEWTGGDRDRKATTLVPLASDLLGAAAIQYAHEPSTIDFLMRSAQRFGGESDRGFALIAAEGNPVHFCWVKNFEGFEMQELGRILQAPSKNAVMIFDCFTPVSARGQGFFAVAIAELADQLLGQNQGPWIFAAAANQDSLRGIRKSGFTHRFSLGRRRVFFLAMKKDSFPSVRAEQASSASEL